MKKNFRFLFGAIFTSIGALALGIALFSGMRTMAFVKASSVGLGKVVRIASRSGSDGTEYAPVVRFQSSDGREHEFTGSTWSNVSFWREGETTSVLYDSNNPSEARLKSFFDLWFITIIPGIIGFVFCSVGGFFLFRYYKRRRNERWLKANGTSVKGKIIAVRPCSEINVNGQSPFVIECQWRDASTGKVCVSVSDELWFDPVTSGHVQVGSELRVLTDPNNPRLSWVDIEHLKALAA